MSNFDHLMGFIPSPKADLEAFTTSLPIPRLYDAKDIKGTGKGKVVKLYDFTRKVYGKDIAQVQVIGDCQNPTDKVRMADGSEKNISDVQVGEYVITPQGNTKKVLNTIKKPYNGNMVKIYVKGYDKPIASTPDHLYMTLPNIGRNGGVNKELTEWKPIVSLNEGDYVLIPKLPSSDSITNYDMSSYYKSITHDMDFKKLRVKPVAFNKVRAIKTSTEINRFIELNEKVCWLIGMYAAEGSHDILGDKAVRITFNLSSDEIVLAQRIVSYIKEIFDFDAVIRTVPSKPSVMYVRISNILISEFFVTMCPGNVYSKAIKSELLLTSNRNKLALLSGWVDGDGYQGKLGTSVSNDLITDMFNIALSIGINPSIYTRKPRKQSKQSYNLSMNNSQLLQDTKNFTAKSFKYAKLNISLGKPAKIKKIEVVQPDTDYVYCLEVEDDHAFICNGYAIHNCVSFGYAHAIDYTNCFEIINGDLEELKALTATEFIYGYSRVQIGNRALGNGDGSYGIWGARTIVEGTVFREEYDKYDLRTYSGTRAKDWGYKGAPKELVDISKNFPIKTVTRISTYEEARDAIANGYAISVCSNQGFTTKRDKNGMCSPSSTWAHCMAVIGVDDTKGIVCILNSWGKYMTGPTYLEAPEEAFWITGETLEKRMLSVGESYAISDRVGFPLKKIKIDWFT